MVEPMSTVTGRFVEQTAGPPRAHGRPRSRNFRPPAELPFGFAVYARGATMGAPHEAGRNGRRRRWNHAAALWSGAMPAAAAWRSAPPKTPG
jgi:hypothetical protein